MPKRMPPTAIAVLFLVVLIPQPSTAAGELEERIARVEEGLLPRVVERGKEGIGHGIVERMAAHEVPGLSLAVIDGGKIDWAKGYGVIGEKGAKVTTETLFLAGSISKPVAATGALRLVQEGKLELDTDVNQKLKSWQVETTEVMGKERVTLRRLLTHTAGLTVHGFPGYAADTDVPTVQQVLDGEKPANTVAVRVDLEPGSEWRYSGGGYTVMQLLLSEVTDRPFPELMAATVLEPLGMRASTYENPLPADRYRQAAHGHWATGKPVRGRWHTYPEMAAAGLWTTASDLARWAIGIQEALAGQTAAVLDREAARQMLTPHLGDWGLGPALAGEGESLRFHHGGRDAGFDARLVAFAHRGQGAVILINANNNRGLLGEILESVARAYRWPDAPEPEQHTYIVLPPEDLGAYVGNFEGETRTFRVSASDGKLYAFTKGLPRLELLAAETDRFFFLTTAGTLTFERDTEGAVVALAFERGEERERASRVD